MLNTVKLLRERGIQVRSISDGIDPVTPTGRLMLNMLATIAEYERELIVERVNAGIAAASQNGTRFGRPTRLDELVAAQACPVVLVIGVVHNDRSLGIPKLFNDVFQAAGTPVMSTGV